MTDRKPPNPAVAAFLEQSLAYFRDPHAAPHDNPTKAPTLEIGMDVAAETAKLMALILDVHRTGKLPEDVFAEPSMQSRLEVAEMIARYIDQAEGGT